MKLRGLCAVLSIGALALAGCGSSKGKPDLTVSAAASLKAAFTQYGRGFAQANPRFSFSGSDILAAQIEQGIRPDVFAAANTKLPELLYSRGLVSKPVTFAANRLVIAVPAGSTKVQRLADIEKPGITLAIGSPTVPIGAYARKVLGKLGPILRARILAHVRSNEPDVTGIVGKLTQGAVDAGFTYATDVRATKGRLKAIALPARLQPVVAYAAAIVRGTAHQALARAFINGLLSGSGQADLTRFGFLPAPTK